MLQWLRKRFGRQAVQEPNETGAGEDHGALEGPADVQSMFPPRTVSDSAAWDRYWQDQLSHQWAAFLHLFVSDGLLVDTMRANGLRTVLCIGNGVSQEPKAMAWAGCEVTALDISPLAAQVARDATPPEDFLAGLVDGRSGGLNGHVEFVVGDICDPACCPGPYDVVIDQLAAGDGDTMSVMLGTHAKVREFTPKALAAGGTNYDNPEDVEFMYTRSFVDPDGHGWGLLHRAPQPDAPVTPDGQP